METIAARESVTKDHYVDKKRILVVDDEPAVTRVIARFLENTGRYEVVKVNDPLRAVEIAKAFAPQLAVLGIVMPGLDGGELLARLRALDDLSEFPAMVLIGLVSEAEVGKDGYEISGQPVIAKPVRIEAFRVAVAQRLG